MAKKSLGKMQLFTLSACRRLASGKGGMKGDAGKGGGKAMCILAVLSGRKLVRGTIHLLACALLCGFLRVDT